MLLSALAARLRGNKFWNAFKVPTRQGLPARSWVLLSFGGNCPDEGSNLPYSNPLSMRSMGLVSSGLLSSSMLIVH